MKATVYDKHGSRDALELPDADEPVVPVVKEDEVLKRLVFLTPLVGGALIHFLWKPLEAFPEWWVGLTIGLLLVVAGILLLAWAVRTMFRVGEDPDSDSPTSAIVANGPYALSRNPIYVSFNVFYVGIATAMNSIWPIIFLPVGIAVLQYRVIAREESYLESAIGDEYRQYKARVRRWI